MRAKRRIDFEARWQPEAAYDAAAKHYDDWLWQRVWHAVEDDLIETSIRSKQAKTLRILDVGCGTGTLLSHINNLESGNVELVGIDISRGMLKLAQKKLKHQSIELIHEDFLSSKFAPQSFDVILMCRVASHIADLSACFEKVSSLLKRGGTFTFSDVYSRHPYECTRLPHRDGKIPVVTYKHRLREIVRAAYGSSLVLASLKGFSADQLALDIKSDPKLPRTLSVQLEGGMTMPFGCLMTFSSRRL